IHHLAFGRSQQAARNIMIKNTPTTTAKEETKLSITSVSKINNTRNGSVITWIVILIILIIIASIYRRQNN
ncbi:MAG: hypothetical protein WCF94_03850, partial [bacterium]